MIYWFELTEWIVEFSFRDRHLTLLMFHHFKWNSPLSWLVLEALLRSPKNHNRNHHNLWTLQKLINFLFEGLWQLGSKSRSFWSAGSLSTEYKLYNTCNVFNFSIFFQFLPLQRATKLLLQRNFFQVSLQPSQHLHLDWNRWVKARFLSPSLIWQSILCSVYFILLVMWCDHLQRRS